MKFSQRNATEPDLFRILAAQCDFVTTWSHQVQRRFQRMCNCHTPEYSIAWSSVGQLKRLEMKPLSLRLRGFAVTSVGLQMVATLIPVQCQGAHCTIFDNLSIHKCVILITQLVNFQDSAMRFACAENFALGLLGWQKRSGNMDFVASPWINRRLENVVSNLSMTFSLYFKLYLQHPQGLHWFYFASKQTRLQ